MPGPAPKPKERRQRRNKTAEVVYLPPQEGMVSGPQIPKAPTKLLKVTRDRWEAYWLSPLATAADPVTDLPAITRLFTLYDERERCYQMYRKERLVVGSQGQFVINPLGKMMQAHDAEIRQLEDRLGMTPKSRAQLGITLAGAKKSMDDLNRSLEADLEDDPR